MDEAAAEIERLRTALDEAVVTLNKSLEEHAQMRMRLATSER